MTLALAASACLVAVVLSPWDTADEHATRGEHALAAKAYARAWDEEHAVAILYSWGQAARLSGDCTAAVDLYDRFTGEGVSPPTSYDTKALRAQWTQMLDNAAVQREVCADGLVQSAVAVPLVAPEPVPRTPPVESEPVEFEPVESVPVVGPAPVPRRSGPAPMADDSVARADPVGWALVGVGAAAAIAGGVMVGIAASRDRTAESAADHDRFLAELEGARVQQTAGLVMFGVGTALAVGGVVRLLVVRQRREHPRTRIGARGVTFQF